jgi:hypothetical protein
MGNFRRIADLDTRGNLEIERHARLSVICALSVALWMQRFDLYFELLDYS